MIYPVKGDLPLWEAQYRAMLTECPFGPSVPKGAFEAAGAPGEGEVPTLAPGENDVGEGRAFTSFGMTCFSVMCSVCT